MNPIQIDPRDVEFGERLREVDQDWAAILAETFRKEGRIRTPIEVRPANEDGRYQLVSGGHRVSGALIAELPLIDAYVFEGTDLEAKLREIEENLVRNELSELDRMTFLAEHKAVWEALYPETKHGGDRRKKASRQNVDLNAHPLAERFSAAAAAKIGITERSIQRAIARYRALSPAVRRRLTGTWMAQNAAALDALIDQGRDEEERHELLDILLAEEGGTRNVGDAVRRLRNLPAKDPLEKAIDRLSVAWTKAPQDAREDVLRTWLTGAGDRPVAARKLVRRLLAEAEGQA